MNNYFLHYNILVKDLKGNFVGEFNSLSEAVEALSIHVNTKSNIRSCLLGNRSKACGYIWERKETEFTPLVNEEWKDVVGFEHLYAVSSLGRIASKQFHGKYDFRVLKQTDIDGYKFVKLRFWIFICNKTNNRNYKQCTHSKNPSTNHQMKHQLNSQINNIEYRRM